MKKRKSNPEFSCSDCFQPDKYDNVKQIKAPQALHNTPPLLGAPKVIL